VVLIVGVLAIAPGVLKGRPCCSRWYTWCWRCVRLPRHPTPGCAPLDLKTIVEASNSLGAGWRSNAVAGDPAQPLRSRCCPATVLTVAMVLGEFTIASLDLYQTLPVWIYVNSQTSARLFSAASLLALFVTWIFLLPSRSSEQAVAQDRWRRVNLVHRPHVPKRGRLMTTHRREQPNRGRPRSGRPSAGAAPSVLLRDLTAPSAPPGPGRAVHRDGAR